MQNWKKKSPTSEPTNFGCEMVLSQDRWLESHLLYPANTISATRNDSQICSYGHRWWHAKRIWTIKCGFVAARKLRGSLLRTGGEHETVSWGYHRSCILAAQAKCAAQFHTEYSTWTSMDWQRISVTVRKVYLLCKQRWRCGAQKLLRILFRWGSFVWNSEVDLWKRDTKKSIDWARSQNYERTEHGDEDSKF